MTEATETGRSATLEVSLDTDSHRERLAEELERHEARKAIQQHEAAQQIRIPEGGDRSIWLMHAVLRDKLAGLAPGEAIYVRYEGRRTRGKGFDYHDYTVEREGPGTAF